MSANTKAIGFSIIIFFVVFTLLYLILSFLFKNVNGAILSGITAFLSVVLSPRRTIVKKQSREEVQLKWIFSKTIIIIK